MANVSGYEFLKSNELVN